MGAKKGTDHFTLYRKQNQEISVELLSTELGKARRRKMQYPDKATLVTDMSERTKIHRTTLIRNPAYHRLLLEFLGGQAGGSFIVSDNDATPELLRAKLIDAQLEIGNLKKALESTKKELNLTTKIAIGQSEKISDSVAYSAFSDTVWVLRTVIERINSDGDILEIDVNRLEIRDLAASPGRQVIISGQKVKSFVDAYKKLLQQEE